MGKTVTDGMVQELKRGTITLAVLSLTNTPRYGYSLVTELRDAGIDVEQNTLYPLLRRLENQGLLTSTWNTDESRPRKYYGITPEGRKTADFIRGQWEIMTMAIRGLLEENE